MKFGSLHETKVLFFTYRDVARLFRIKPASARVAVSRYVRSGFLVRAKRDLYLLKERWLRLKLEEQFILANHIQVPSYVSLTTALSYHGLTTQIQQNFIESVALKRTKEVHLEETIFRFTKINKKFYQGFEKHEGFFIAQPEKALVDALYLASFGRYHLDWSALEWRKLNSQKINTWLKKYPKRVELYWRQYARIYRARKI